MRDPLVLTYDDPAEAAKVGATFAGLHQSGAPGIVDSLIGMTDAGARTRTAAHEGSRARGFGRVHQASLLEAVEGAVPRAQG